MLHTVYVEPQPASINVCEAEVIPPRWYLRAITAGGAYGDTVIVAATHLSNEGGSVLLQRETATAFQTGPLLGATADSAGYELLFDPDGFPDPGCQFGCKAKIAVGSAAVWTLVLALFGVFGE